MPAAGHIASTFNEIQSDESFKEGVTPSTKKSPKWKTLPTQRRYGKGNKVFARPKFNKLQKYFKIRRYSSFQLVILYRTFIFRQRMQMLEHELVC